MLLEVKPLPRDLLVSWEAEIVDTTALGASWVSCAPTGHSEEYRVPDPTDPSEEEEASGDLARSR